MHGDGQSCRAWEPVGGEGAVALTCCEACRSFLRICLERWRQTNIASSLDIQPDECLGCCTFSRMPGPASYNKGPETQQHADLVPLQPNAFTDREHDVTLLHKL